MCIIGDDTKSGVGRVLFHNPAQRHLRGSRHGISFVKDDQFERSEARSGLCGWRNGKYLLGACGDRGQQKL
jgi:hypothetical protein